MTLIDCVYTRVCVLIIETMFVRAGNIIRRKSIARDAFGKSWCAIYVRCNNNTVLASAVRV